MHRSRMLNSIRHPPKMALVSINFTNRSLRNFILMNWLEGHQHHLIVIDQIQSILVDLRNSQRRKQLEEEVEDKKRRKDVAEFKSG